MVAHLATLFCNNGCGMATQKQHHFLDSWWVMARMLHPIIMTKLCHFPANAKLLCGFRFFRLQLFFDAVTFASGN